MLTVYCVCVGDKYEIDYVYRLQGMVEKNLTIPYRFVCVTEHDIPGVDTVKPLSDYKSWWVKLDLFQIATGRSLYFDLDVVITGNLDYLAEYTKLVFSAPMNWAQSGYGGIQSSVMAWNGTWKEPYLLFDYDKDSERLWGDQEFLTELAGDRFVKLPGIYSYKYHCRNGLIPEARVVVFHGKPDYHEVGDRWVKESAYTPIEA